MKYLILVHDQLTQMEDDVEWKSKDGWKLQGGLSVIQYPSKTIYYQAMTKGK